MSRVSQSKHGWFLSAVRKRTGTFAAGVGFAVVCFLGINIAIEPTSKSQYCGSKCHEMKEAYRSWELSPHGSNAHGFRVVFIDDKNITHLPIHRRARLGLGYLPQEASIFRRMTVAQNIQSVLELQGLSDEDIQSRLEELLEDLHITHIRDNPAVSLSGGERRRVEIARALATDPRFILLDEPFAGVDPIAVLDIQKIIRFLKERNIGVLITDHNVRETLGICDRAYIINAGSVMAEGNPDEIIYNEGVRKVYLGEHFKL